MRVLRKSNKRLESIMNSQWETATGTTTRWIFWGHDKIMLVPADISGFTGKYCKVGYIEMPDYMSSSSDTVDSRIPITHQEYLKFAAAHYLLSLRTDKQFIDLAEYFLAQFYKLIGAQNPEGKQRG